MFVFCLWFSILSKTSPASLRFGQVSGQDMPLPGRLHYFSKYLAVRNLRQQKKAWTFELRKDGNITNKQKRVIIISILLYYIYIYTISH